MAERPAVRWLVDQIVACADEADGGKVDARAHVKRLIAEVRAEQTAVPHRCFSRSGWWQTLCGLDAANQGFGWTSRPEHVGCEECRLLVVQGEHKRRPASQYMKYTTRGAK